MVKDFILSSTAWQEGYRQILHTVARREGRRGVPQIKEGYGGRGVDPGQGEEGRRGKGNYTWRRGPSSPAGKRHGELTPPPDTSTCSEAAHAL